MKTKSSHRHLHPIHWHGSMIVAVAALLITSFKCSNEMLRALHAVPTPPAITDNIYLRDAETGHTPVILNLGTRHATVGGK